MQPDGKAETVEHAAAGPPRNVLVVALPLPNETGPCLTVRGANIGDDIGDLGASAGEDITEHAAGAKCPEDAEGAGMHEKPGDADTCLCTDEDCCSGIRTGDCCRSDCDR